VSGEGPAGHHAKMGGAVAAEDVKVVDIVSAVVILEQVVDVFIVGVRPWQITKIIYMLIDIHYIYIEVHNENYAPIKNRNDLQTKGVHGERVYSLVVTRVPVAP
jgi:hypothetical protein